MSISKSEVARICEANSSIIAELKAGFAYEEVNRTLAGICRDSYGGDGLEEWEGDHPVVIRETTPSITD